MDDFGRQLGCIFDGLITLALAALPEGFLPVPVRQVLLGTEDEDGGTAISGTKRFRRWAKYFDAYMIWLEES